MSFKFEYKDFSNMKIFFGANLKRKRVEFKIQLVSTIVESYPALFLIKFKAIVFEQRR